MYETEGIELQLQYLGTLLGAFTVDVGALSTYTHLWGYDELRRARTAPREPAGRRALARLPDAAAAAPAYAAEPHPDPDLVLADPLMEGKVAIVTGAAQGIGRAIAEGSPAAGARIVIADLQGAEEAAAAFPDGVGITADVADEADVQRLVDETVERCGTIDVLVNNAGLYASLEMRPFEQIPLEEWRKVMDVNVASMFLTCKAVVPVMREHGGGKIVNISSGTPFRGVPFLLHYVTSKGAIVALTRALAKELGKDNVLVNCVAPGFTMSAGRRGAPRSDREAARRLRLGAHDPARPGAGRRRRRGRVPLRRRLRLHHRPVDRDRRRPDLPLILRLTGSPATASRPAPATTSSTTSPRDRGARSARRASTGARSSGS